MGSYNAACFASQQTITPGDEAIIFPIVQQSTFNPVQLLVRGRDGVEEVAKYGHANNTCHATSLWGYCGPMIEGVYDDYGQFLLKQTERNEQHLRLFLNFMAEKVCDVKQGENSVHDHPLTYADLFNQDKDYSFSELVVVWDTLWELAQEARLFVRNYKGEPASVAFATMHKVVGEYLVETLSKRETLTNQSLEPKTYFTHYFNERLDRIFEALDEKDWDSTIAFAAITVNNLEDFGIGSGEGVSVNHFYRTRKVTEKIREYFKNNPGARTVSSDVIDDIYNIFQPQIEHRYIASVIDELNINIVPMAYAGQCYRNEIGNEYLALIQEANKRVNQLVFDRHGEEEDDEEE